MVIKGWRSIKPNIDIPKLDSHCSTVHENKMYVYGGYMSEKAKYLQNVLAFDFITNTWEVFYKFDDQKN